MGASVPASVALEQARTIAALERELAAMTAERDALRREVETWELVARERAMGRG